MQDNVTISTFQLFKMFPDQESARKYFESRLWPEFIETLKGGQNHDTKHLSKHQSGRD